MVADGLARVREAARNVLGFAELRPGQAEAMAAAAAGRDVLAVLATGSGKSAIYQVAGLLRGGTTVVVSPLIALQRDQLHRLAGSGSDGSGAVVELNSSDPVAERRAALEALAAGRARFVLLAPEQLANPDTRAALLAARPSLLAVDEAHLVSEWGQEFRPDYLRLGAAAGSLGRPPLLALTATAAPPVRDEIVDRLGMTDPVVIVGGFDRPRIWLGCTRHADEAHKHRRLLDAVSGASGPGIVYTATHRHADELAHDLVIRGHEAAAYHAGLSAADRSRVQDEFFAERLRVVVATVAFGMGIDKPDIRWVFHAEPSQSVDAYYQEFGRAGRDGDYAEARLFYREQDLGLRRAFASRGTVSADDVATVVEAVAAGAVTDDELRAATGLSHARITRTTARLADAGRLTIDAAGAVSPTGAFDVAGAQEAVAAAEQERHDVERSRVEMMAAYAEHRYCRRAWLLGYFGEPYSAPCGNCDNCDAGRGLAPETGAGQPFPVGSRVQHATFGDGAVERYDGAHVLVLFDHAGYKTLNTAVAVARGALRALQ